MNKMIIVFLLVSCSFATKRIYDSLYVSKSIKTDSSLYVGDTTTVSTEPCKFVLKDNATSRVMNSRLQYDFGKFGLSCIDIDIAKDPDYYIQGLQLWGPYDTMSYLYLGMKPEDASLSAYLYLMSVEGFDGDFTLRTGYNGAGNIFANTDLTIGAGDSIQFTAKAVARDTFIIDSVFNVRNQPVASGPDTFFVKDAGSDRVKVYPVSTLMAHGVTTNYLPKATGATTWGNSLIYENGTNIGIGTTSPLTNLEVKAQSGDPGVVTIMGNYNISAVGQEFSSLQFRSGDASILSANDIAGKIAAVAEHSNGAWAGMSFFTADNSVPPYLNERMRISRLGIITSYYGLNLDYSTANMVLVTDASKNVVASGYIDSTESGSPENKHLMLPPYLYIEPNTVDGNDTGVVHIGGIGSGRGGKVSAYGNEHTSSPGKVDIQCGDEGFNSIGDTTNFFGDVVLDDRDANRPLGTNSNKKIVHADSSYSVACSLYDGATYRATATAYIYTIGSLFHILLPELSGTITGGNTILLKFASGTLPAPKGSEEPRWVVWALLVSAGPVYDQIDMKYEDTSSFRLRDTPGADLGNETLTFYSKGVSWEE